MDMKAKDLDLAKDIVSQFENVCSMERAAATLRPGRLSIHGYTISVPWAKVIDMIGQERQRLIREADAIGLELEE